MSKNEANSKTSKMKWLGRFVIIILILCIILVVSAIVFAYKFVTERLENINYVEINKEDLNTNTEVVENNIVTKEEFEEIRTIALFGSDSRNVNDMYVGRADSIIVASLNPKTKSIKLLSIPRDTYVNIPGYGFDKINHAYAYGKEELLVKTINSNFALNITEYITIDFLGLADVVNSIGGIEMDITADEMSVINRYLKEIYALEGKPYEEMTVCGRVLLNGEQAVAHCRDRYVGNDFTRAGRQRDVIATIIQKVSTFENEKKIECLDYSLTKVQTNVDVKEYLPEITNVVLNLAEYRDNLFSAQIPATEYGYDKYVNGIYYYGADLEKAKQDFWNYIYEK